MSDLTGSRGGVPLVDDLVVVDDWSSDRTADVAAQAGARVVAAETPGGGKGQAMRSALEATDADLVVFVDADVTTFGSHFVTGLLGPLLFDDSITLVKGLYQRPLHGAPDGGGRVTELTAKPIIDLLFLHLASIEQPLAGETAAPRWVLERCGLADGYAVELALLIDVAARFGVETIAQVDLGVRAHRNRPLSELRPQATDILHAALARCLADGSRLRAIRPTRRRSGQGWCPYADTHATWREVSGSGQVSVVSGISDESPIGSAWSTSIARSVLRRPGMNRALIAPRPTTAAPT